MKLHRPGSRSAGGYVVATVKSLELVDPFRPDLDPEPNLVFGLQDAANATQMATTAHKLAQFFFGSTALLSSMVASPTGRAAAAARLKLLQGKFVGSRATFLLQPPTTKHAFPIISNIGAPP